MAHTHTRNAQEKKEKETANECARERKRVINPNSFEAERNTHSQLMKTNEQ